jgi:signal transduction histidine kinase
MQTTFHIPQNEHGKTSNGSFLKEDEENLLTAFAKIQHLNDIKSEFITTVSHEFRTPLAVMQSAIVLAKHYGEKGQMDKVGIHLAEIEASMKALNGLIDQVAELNWSDEDSALTQLTEYTQNHNIG